MPSSSTSHPAPPKNTYWLTRQWIYVAPVPVTVIQTVPRESSYAVDQSGRPLTADDRKSEPADAGADAKVVFRLVEMSFIQFQQRYQHQVHQKVRPITAKLLALMWSANGEPVVLETVCRRLWGRAAAPTYHTFHATVHKANAALRQAGSPLRLKSRLNQMIFVV